VSEHPDWIQSVEKIMEAGRRICSMRPDTTICLNCGHQVWRTAYNASPVWEHATPDGERHGPFPRTLCPLRPGQAWDAKDRTHARPNINKLLSADDIAFLHDLRIGIGPWTSPEAAHLNWRRNHGGRP